MSGAAPLQATMTEAIGGCWGAHKMVGARLVIFGRPVVLEIEARFVAPVPLTEAQWHACNDLWHLRAHACACFSPSERQVRLFACACARLGLSQLPSAEDYRQVIET